MKHRGLRHSGDGVNYQTFASWIQKRRRERGLYPALRAGGGEPLRLTLAEVELAAHVPADDPPGSPRAPAFAEIVLPGGVSVLVTEGAGVSFVVELVKALRSC